MAIDSASGRDLWTATVRNQPPSDRRIAAWGRLAKELPMDKLDQATNRGVLADLPELGGKILKGGIRGRTVIDVNG